MEAVVVDASVILAAYLPDESTVQAQWLMKDYVTGRISLWAPRLLLLELLNACLVASKRGRLDQHVINKLVAQITLLQVNWIEMEEQARRIFSIGRELGLTAYDSAYIVAATLKGGCRLITADEKMYTSAREAFPFVTRLRDYRGATPVPNPTP